MEEFEVPYYAEPVLGAQQREPFILTVHNKSDCGGPPHENGRPTCVIHNPSSHHMLDWPLNWRADRRLMERICPHGVGHPDPDHVSYVMHTRGVPVGAQETIHGCDRCCNTPVDSSVSHSTIDTSHGVPWCSTQWSEITDGLYVGGVYHAPDNMDVYYPVPVMLTDEFDAVYSFYVEEQFNAGPAAGVPHLIYEIPDGSLQPYHLGRLWELARLIAVDFEQGKKVLLRCQAGYNRSALVAALTMLHLGMSPKKAIDLIRERRSPYALCNNNFVDYIYEAGR